MGKKMAYKISINKKRKHCMQKKKINRNTAINYEEHNYKGSNRTKTLRTNNTENWKMVRTHQRNHIKSIKTRRHP